MTIREWLKEVPWTILDYDGIIEGHFSTKKEADKYAKIWNDDFKKDYPEDWEEGGDEYTVIKTEDIKKWW